MKNGSQSEEIPKMNFLYTAIMLALTISWFVSMIRASILSAQEGQPNFTLIATITTSAIMFSFSLPVAILFYLSSKGRNHKQVSAVLPDSVVITMNKWIEQTFSEGTPFENGIVVVGSITAAALIGQATFDLHPLLFPVFLILGLVLYSIDQRRKKKLRLLAMLANQDQISFKVAKKRLDLGKKSLTTMVMDLAVEGYPIGVDENENTIYRTGPILKPNAPIVQPQNYPASAPISNYSTPITETCAYCGESNPIAGAKFCIKCGASMVPAK